MHPKNNGYISFVEKSNPAHLIPLIFLFRIYNIEPSSTYSNHASNTSNNPR